MSAGRGQIDWIVNSGTFGDDRETRYFRVMGAFEFMAKEAEMGIRDYEFTVQDIVALFSFISEVE